jgi:hypothetical protein
MSKKQKKSRRVKDETQIRVKSESEGVMNEGNQNNLLSQLKANWLVVLIIVVLSLGTFGAGLKYLEDDARRELAKRESQKDKLFPDKENFAESLLNTVNPFLPAPLPNPTPQLAKEYIYAGSKLLSVEDANANAAAPADLAIWRPSSGEWYVLNGNGTYTIQGWGTNEDDPVEGDYDGDGKTDLAVFRPSNGTWHISQSSNAQTITQAFGLTDDVPAPADYDGDGRADIAVWRNSNTTFYSINTTNSQLAMHSLGASGDKPVPSDYDGDGKADYAIRSGANWLIKQSTNNQVVTVAWEQSTDKAVHNDYDGDGKTDIAVWRSSNGNWYIRQSATNTTRTAQWGIAGDIPVPAFYRR